MKRREFLKNIVGAAAAVTIGLRLSYSMPELATEGSKIAFDPLPDVGIRTGHGVMTRADFAVEMQVSLNEAFKDTFLKHYIDDPL